MSKKIIIEESKCLTRIGVIEEERLTQVFLETRTEEVQQNRIIQGQVQQVVKNLQGVFVDFGKEKNGLLHFNQVPEVLANRLQVGARIPVQIKKENHGDKGDRLTAFISIQGYYLVCLPFEPVLQISKKIRSKGERERLKNVLEPLVANYQMGFMIRTHAENKEERLLVQEAMYLLKVASKFMQMKDTMQKGTTLVEPEPLYWQMIRDYVKKEDQVQVITNNEEIITWIKERQQIFLPESQLEFKVYDYCENLFSLLSIEKDFMEILKRKVWLKNGGNIVIDYTEAMTIIDVNSAKAVLTKDRAKAVAELNRLALQESLFQILRRNVSGIVIVDLVDFQTKSDREQFFREAEALFAKWDGSRSRLLPLTEIDLLQIVRTKQYTPTHEKMLRREEQLGRLAYSPSSDFLLFQIETQLKHIVAHTTQKSIYIYVDALLWQIFNNNDMVSLWQEKYGLEIKILKQDTRLDIPFEIKYHILQNG